MNGIVIVDKPAGMTSHDVVAKLRRIYSTRRVGHSGTLDPMATGVLPVFIGRATRACEFAVCDNKVYSARILLGVTTDTQDITGKVLSRRDVKITAPEMLRACADLVGDTYQIPPMYSAVKVGGKRLYQLARQGVEVARDPRKITVHSIAVKQVDPCQYDLDVHCSKGTYIRTLCADIGNTLGCGATLVSLRRTCSGMFDLSMSRTLSQLERNPWAGLLSVDEMFRRHPALTIDGEDVKKCRNGAPVPCVCAQLGCVYRVYDAQKRFLMLARCEKTEDGRPVLKTIKSFFEVDSDEQ